MDKIAVLDYGGQYAHLIANRIRRLGVYSEIYDGNVNAEKLRDYKGIVLSGGPSSVREDHSLKCDLGIFDLSVPILGLCYGHQLIAKMLGGEVEQGKVREYGRANLNILEKEGILQGLEDNETVWMSHFDQVSRIPEGFELIAKTEDCPIAGMQNRERLIYSLQFHPEVTHTPKGRQVFENFLEITGAKREWNINTYIDDIVKEIKERVGDKKVFLMISGGVDSTVAFLLLDKALGQEKVYGLFVDTGFMRENERVEVEESLKSIGVKNLHIYEASEEYFKALKEVYDPEEKRRIIGDLFLDIQQKVSDELGLNPEEWILGQGTIYPDTIETGGTKHADKIKTHHNRVERIARLIEEGKVIEPINQLYKDEVRLVGRKLNLNDRMVERHPFPGPGLAVRCLCADKAEYPDNKEALEDSVSQMVTGEGLKALVLPIKSVGVQGDERTYRHPVLLYGKRLDWSRLDVLTTRLTNQFGEINRVLYGLTPNEIADLTIQKSYLTKERISALQRADKIVMDYLLEANIGNEIWQFPTVQIPVILNSQNKECLVLRPVCSEEAMTANFYQMDTNHLEEMVKRLTATELYSGIFYDITNKPPGTIEWE